MGPRRRSCSSTLAASGGRRLVVDRRDRDLEVDRRELERDRDLEVDRRVLDRDLVLVLDFGFELLPKTPPPRRELVLGPLDDPPNMPPERLDPPNMPPGPRELRPSIPVPAIKISSRPPPLRRGDRL